MIGILYQRVILAMVVLGAFQIGPNAQGVDLTELQRQIQVFSGVLKEGLALNTSNGFLDINGGRVTHVYLHNQGVLFEVRTPLANQRNRVSLSALASSIRSFSGTANPFEMIARQQSAVSSAQSRVAAQIPELSAQADFAEPALSPIDYQVRIEDALREAYRGVRMLQEFDGITEDSAGELSRELDSLGQQSSENLTLLTQLQQAPLTASPSAVETGEPRVMAGGGEQRVEELQFVLQNLGDRAQQMANEINDRYEQARADYNQRWHQDIQAFENSLFGVLCDYGAMLRDLPADEHVTLVLIGLGEDSRQALAADSVHVVAKADLVACQSGDLDWQGLQQRAISYAY